MIGEFLPADPIPGAGTDDKEDAMRSWKSPVLIAVVTCGVVALAGLNPGLSRAQGKSGTPMTPPEMVATYEHLADAILAVKKTEENLVRSILAGTYAHAHAALGRARMALKGGDTAAARTSIENLAAAVGQLGTEGDNAVAAIRKRLLEGGHHHHAKEEAEGIYDPGFVIVTRTAKKAFLDSSRAFGQMAQNPTAAALDAEWGKVEATWNGLMGMGKKH